MMKPTRLLLMILMPCWAGFLLACGSSPGGLSSVDAPPTGPASVVPGAQPQRPGESGSVNAGGPPERPASPVDLDPGCPICLMLKAGRTPDDLEQNWREFYGNDCLETYRRVYESGEIPPLCQGLLGGGEELPAQPVILTPRREILDRFPAIPNFDTLPKAD